MKLNAKNERKLVNEILIKLGVQENQADIVAQATVDADLKGFTSHGIGRFSQYIKGFKTGHINLEGDITIEKETEAIALINGNSLFGQYVARKAMDLAIEKAKKVGIGLVGTHNANHFGVTGYYSDLASREGCVGVVIANTEPAIAPFGGKKPLIGTNPIAIGVPNDDTYIALDMATSVSARGKLLEAKRKGESIPEGTALDKDGNPTTDPAKGIEGSILPFGGFKGYGLAFLIEILTGPLVNAGVGTGVTGTANYDANCTKGDLFLAIDPEKFVGEKQFNDETNRFLDEVRADNGVIPGALEVERVKGNLANGWELDPVLYDTLKEICENVDIDIDSFAA
jgi:L-2-hydroxycarboxylate dehydrogenase (NAD+)